MSTVKEGQSVKVHYKGTLTDGTEFDNSRSRGGTLDFQVGGGQMIPGFDKALMGMGLGEVKTFTLSPDEAYGDVNDTAMQAFPKTAFGEDFEFTVGHLVHGSTPAGEPLVAKIASVDDESVTLDLNHPLAGETLTFEVELIEIEE